VGLHVAKRGAELDRRGEAVEGADAEGYAAFPGFTDSGVRRGSARPKKLWEHPGSG
jgi:hypothetical protein